MSFCSKYMKKKREAKDDLLKEFEDEELLKVLID